MPVSASKQLFAQIINSQKCKLRKFAERFEAGEKIERSWGGSQLVSRWLLRDMECTTKQYTTRQVRGQEGKHIIGLGICCLEPRPHDLVCVLYFYKKERSLK